MHGPWGRAAHGEAMSIGAVVLAAGASTRMGEAGPKALLALDDGRTFVARIVATLRAAGVEEIVIVVAPPHERAITAALPTGVRVARNALPERGMLSSMQAGVAALDATVDATLIWPVDLPLVAVETARAILEADRGRLIIPMHQERGGHPVRVPRARFAELLALDPALGLRTLVQSRPDEVTRLEVGDAMILRDVDTPADLRSLVEKA